MFFPMRGLLGGNRSSQDRSWVNLYEKIKYSNVACRQLKKGVKRSEGGVRCGG
jgi:hypothetical protein